MKLESLKSSKFEAFKGSELQNSFKVLGGAICRTRDIGASSWSDCHDTGSSDNKATDTKGNDASYDNCPTGIYRDTAGQFFYEEGRVETVSR